MPPLHNPQRGEILVPLGDHTCVLRPTFAALAEIEAATGCPLVALARRLAQGEGRLTDLQAILVAGLRGADQPVPADLADQIIAAGPLPLHAPLLDFLIGAITGTPKRG